LKKLCTEDLLELPRIWWNSSTSKQWNATDANIRLCYV